MSEETWATIAQLDAVTASVQANADAIMSLEGVVSTNANDADAAWLILCGTAPTLLHREEHAQWGLLPGAQEWFQRSCVVSSALRALVPRSGDLQQRCLSTRNPTTEPQKEAPCCPGRGRIPPSNVGPSGSP
jgi:hypothetical protein